MTITDADALEADIAAWVDREISDDGRVMAEAIDEPGIDARLAAYLAGLGYRKVVPDTVTLALRWADDDDGDSLLLLSGFPVGTVFSVGHDREWHAYGRGITHAIRIKSLSTKAEAMAALQAAVLKALAE